MNPIQSNSIQQISAISTANAARLGVFAIMALAAALPASAQKQTPPEGGPPTAFTVPAHQTYTLPNGLQVTLIPYGLLPKVTVSVNIAGGRSGEGPGHVGVAGIAADLMKRGTATLTGDQLADAAARMGSTLDISTGSDRMYARMDVLSEFGPDAVKLIADVLEHPRLPEAELPRLKNDELRSISLQMSRPQAIADVRLAKLLYGDHPYSVVVPTEADVKKITLDEVKAFIAASVAPQRAHLYIAGKFDPDAIMEAIRQSLGSWPKTGTPWTPNIPAVKPQRILDVTDRPGAPQSTLAVALPVAAPTSPDYIPLSVTNDLLGGSFGSRITANIREKNGYTYSPYSQLATHFHEAYWEEAADVTTQYTGASLKEIFFEIDRLAKEPPTAAELKGIQNYESGLFIILNSNRGALIDQFSTVDFQGLGDDYLTTYVQKVNAVTPADVSAMTAKYLRPKDVTIVVVGDKSKITTQLTPYESGKIP